ncbi:hypothetical protein [Streptomyces sp. NPDC018034]
MPVLTGGQVSGWARRVRADGGIRGIGFGFGFGIGIGTRLRTDVTRGV